MGNKATTTTTTTTNTTTTNTTTTNTTTTNTNTDMTHTYSDIDASINTLVNQDVISNKAPLSSAVPMLLNLNVDIDNKPIPESKLKRQMTISKHSQIEDVPEVSSWYEALGVQQRLQIVLQYMLRPLEREDEDFYVPRDLQKMILKFAHWSVFHLWNYGKHDEAVQVLNLGLNARCISPENKIAIVLFGEKITPNSGLKYRVKFQCVRMISYQAAMCVGENFKYQLGNSWPEWPTCSQNVVIWYSDAYVPRWNIPDSGKKVKSGSLFGQGHIIVIEVNMTQGLNRVRFYNETTKATEDDVPVDGVPFSFYLGCILAGNGSEVNVLAEEYFK